MEAPTRCGRAVTTVEEFYREKILMIQWIEVLVTSRFTETVPRMVFEKAAATVEKSLREELQMILSTAT